METATAHDMEKATGILAGLIQEGVQWTDLCSRWISRLSLKQLREKGVSEEGVKSILRSIEALEKTGVGLPACARVWKTLEGLACYVVEILDHPNDWERVELDAEGGLSLNEYYGAERVRICRWKAQSGEQS